MKPHARRVRRIIDKLSARIDQQAMQRGADAPHCVATVGSFHRAAGYLESDAGKLPFASVVAHVRILRRVVTTHAIMVRQRGLALRAK